MINQGFKVVNNVAHLNYHNLYELAKEYKTPLYVMDEAELNKRCKTFKESFVGKNFTSTVVYASKAMLVPYIANLMDEYGFYMDSVSLGDLYVAKRCGFPMEHLVFHGNNKSVQELEYAISNNVGIIVVDNLEELKILNKMTKDAKKSVNILIRMNPGIDAHTHKYIQTSTFNSKFGESIYDEKIVDGLLESLKDAPFINLKGFHAHIGSQIHEIEPFLVAVEKMVSFQNMVSEKINKPLSILNLGGGFGIKYTKDEKALELSAVLCTISKALDKILENTTSSIKEVMIEPGRSIVGPSGMTLYECDQIKHTFGGKNYLFVDGGMTDNIRPALYDATYECDVVNKMNNEKEILVDIVGKCCESGDIVRRDIMIPQIERGDILVVYATGAYNYSMSSNYNNHLKPAVVLVGKDVKVISRRETLEDLYRLF